jgi:short-subunit dehydrogenase
MLHYGFPTESEQSGVELQGRNVFITGASSGIGRALARAFARQGCRLILTGRSSERLQQTEREAAARESMTISADLSDTSGIAHVCGQAIARFRQVDVLVNCAGVGLYAPSFDSPPDVVRRLFELNVLAPVEVTRQLLPAMPRGSAVVNISSIAGKVPLPWLTLYSASKYALNAYSDGLRMELSAAGVQVLSVCPGYVDTSFSKNVLVGRIPEKVAGQRRFKITAEKCAEEVLEGLRRDKRTVVTPRIGWLLIAAARLFPGIVHARMAGMRTEAEAGTAARNDAL